MHFRFQLGAILILCVKNLFGFNVTIITTPVFTVDDRFLSVSLDSLSVYPNTWNGLNFTYMLPLASALAPSYFRFGGTFSDLMIFNETNNGPTLQNFSWCPPNHDWNNQCFTLTANQFETMYNFSKAANWRYIFDFNLLLRNVTSFNDFNTSGWDLTNAKKLLDYSNARGFDLDWELGNEPDGFPINFNKTLNLTGQQLVQDFKTCKELINTYDRYKNSLLVGPSSYGSNWCVPEFVRNGGGQYVDALTDHHYYWGGNANVSRFLDPHEMDHYISFLQAYLSYAQGYTGPIWMGETSSAAGGGAANMSDRYVAGFLWLDKLGVSARMGLSVVIRQAFVGAGGDKPFGDYTLLNGNLKPNPESKIYCLDN